MQNNNRMNAIALAALALSSSAACLANDGKKDWHLVTTNNNAQFAGATYTTHTNKRDVPVLHVAALLATNAGQAVATLKELQSRAPQDGIVRFSPMVLATLKAVAGDKPFVTKLLARGTEQPGKGEAPRWVLNLKQEETKKQKRQARRARRAARKAQADGGASTSADA